jgi:hypothetical protein
MIYKHAIAIAVLAVAMPASAVADAAPAGLGGHGAGCGFWSPPTGSVGGYWQRETATPPSANRRLARSLRELTGACHRQR